MTDRWKLRFPTICVREIRLKRESESNINLNSTADSYCRWNEFSSDQNKSYFYRLKLEIEKLVYSFAEMMDKLIKMCLVTHFILFCFILFLFSLDTEFHYLAKWSEESTYLHI